MFNTSSWNRNIAVDLELYNLLDVFFESDLQGTAVKRLAFQSVHISKWTGRYLIENLSQDFGWKKAMIQQAYNLSC